MAADLLAGFERRTVDTSGAAIHTATAGSGPPLLLVHGYPQNHLMWHRVAPTLAEQFTVVAPDLRGYGASSKPPAGPDGAAYSKRAMALDLVEVMETLGFESFAVVGHDRGARVSYRLALDHPERVHRLVTLDVIPTLEQFEMVRGLNGTGIYHWFFLAQPSPLPETLIGPNAEFYLRYMVGVWAGTAAAIDDDAMAAYVAAFTPEVIRATCDDYRAGAGIDCEHDRADRDAGRRITAPLLALWGEAGRPRPWMLETWQRWATDVEGHGLNCGHFIAEEAPDALLGHLNRFLTA